MKKEYAMIQIDKEIHTQLKQFCKERGYKLNGLIEALVKERIKGFKSIPLNTLPSTKISND